MFLRSLMPRGWGDDEVKQELRDALYAIEPAARNGEIVRVTNNTLTYCIYPPMSAMQMPPDYYSNEPMPKPHYWQRGYSFDTSTQKFVLDANKVEVEPTTVYVPITKAASRVRHEGGRWAVYSRDGARRLAEHFTREQAEEHVVAIDARLAQKGA